MLAYLCGIQMGMLGLNGWIDKVNILVMVLVLFGMILYVCCFYLMVGVHEKK